jgi:hypothetical protein
MRKSRQPRCIAAIAHISRGKHESAPDGTGLRSGHWPWHSSKPFKQALLA